jgi:hypothetical protein
VALASKREAREEQVVEVALMMNFGDGCKGGLEIGKGLTPSDITPPVRCSGARLGKDLALVVATT